MWQIVSGIAHRACRFLCSFCFVNMMYIIITMATDTKRRTMTPTTTPAMSPVLSSLSSWPGIRVWKKYLCKRSSVQKRGINQQDVMKMKSRIEFEEVEVGGYTKFALLLLVTGLPCPTTVTCTLVSISAFTIDTFWSASYCKEGKRTLNTLTTTVPPSSLPPYICASFHSLQFL